MKPFLDNYKLGTFKVRGVKVPKLLLGCSPFMGAGQFGRKAREYYSRFFLRPENIKKVILDCIALGINAVQVVGYKQILEPMAVAMEESGVELFILGSAGVEDLDVEIERMLDLNAKCIVVHACLADGNLEGVREHMQRIREKGILTGIATHNPGVEIPIADKIEEVDIILAPLNKLGRFTDPSLSSTLLAIKNSTKKIIAIKPLAAGALKPHDAFAFLADKVSGVAVGITSSGEAEESFEAAKESFR